MYDYEPAKQFFRKMFCLGRALQPQQPL